MKEIMDFDYLIHEFMIYLKSRACSQNTLIAYRNDLKIFKNYIKSKNINCINNLQLIFFVEFSQSIMHHKSSYRQRIKSCIKSFFRFLRIDDHIEFNNAKYLDNEKKPFILPNYFTHQEIETIFNMELNNKKNKAIIEMLYGSGLRVSELCDLKMKDLNIDRRMITVIGKGQKTRNTPISSYSIIALKSYFNEKEKIKFIKHDHHIFTRKNGNRLTRHDVYRIVKKITLLAGIQKKCSPHTFRHSYATHMLWNGADIRVIQDLLGHSSIESTFVYLHLGTDQIHKDFFKFHNRE